MAPRIPWNTSRIDSKKCVTPDAIPIVMYVIVVGGGGVGVVFGFK